MESGRWAEKLWRTFSTGPSWSSTPSLSWWDRAPSHTHLGSAFYQHVCVYVCTCNSSETPWRTRCPKTPLMSRGDGRSSRWKWRPPLAASPSQPSPRPPYDATVGRGRVRQQQAVKWRSLPPHRQRSRSIRTCFYSFYYLFFVWLRAGWIEEKNATIVSAEKQSYISHFKLVTRFSLLNLWKAIKSNYLVRKITFLSFWSFAARRKSVSV